MRLSSSLFFKWHLISSSVCATTTIHNDLFHLQLEYFLCKYQTYVISSVFFYPVTIIYNIYDGEKSFRAACSGRFKWQRYLWDPRRMTCTCIFIFFSHLFACKIWIKIVVYRVICIWNINQNSIIEVAVSKAPFTPESRSTPARFRS